MQILKQSKQALGAAVKLLNKGGVVVCPTDTVYGFLALASSKKAVDKIYKIKKRAKSKPLPVFVKDFKMAKELAEINANLAYAKGFGVAKQEKYLKKVWPGKVTVILKRKKGTKIYDGGKGTIALRIPKHKFLNDLLKKINKPLMQTSVNISNKPSLSKISDIIEQFGNQDILIIDAGNLPKRKPSSIIDFTKEKTKILRK